MADTDPFLERWHHIFKTVSAVPRRQIIESLSQASSGDELPLPEAANTPDYRRDPDELAVELTQSHLPLMAEREYVEWDTNPLRVSRGEAFEDVLAAIKAVHEYDDLPRHLQAGCHRLEEVQSDDE